ncbi:MAG: Glu-tRNA(Gln) amidotransferase subunit GatD [Candidatus Odinarchaeia archaeon]
MNSDSGKNNNIQGYRGYAKEKLEKAGVGVWSVVRIERGGKIFEGIILPRSELGDDQHIVLKLNNGYNIGVKIDEDTKITEISRKPSEYHLPKVSVEFDPAKPNVVLLGTGGTVASRLDYRTGAVIPAFTPEELLSAVPELADICNLTPKTIFEILSENMTPEHWIKIAETIAEEINENNVDGVIVAHGTDTMSYTASALSFMLKNLPVPIVLVGSQRSSDRPSSDAALNLISAATVAAKGDLAEVVVCMHGRSGDDYCLIHRGTRVRKMHSSRRDTFRTIGDKPLGMVKNGAITFFKEDRKKRGKGKVKLDTKLDEKVALIYYYPGMKPDILHHIIQTDYHGVVIAGTGLGHVGRSLFPEIKKCIELNIPVVMTVQTIWGFTGMQVYETGRELLAMGVIPGANMLPETALVKLMWVLGHTRDMDEVRRLMTTNLVGEITEREPYDGFLVLQGIEPEIENFMKTVTE